MNRFLEEIYQQPQALLQTIQHVTDCLTPTLCQQWAGYKSIVLTGMGSSYGAAYYGAALLAQHGIHALAVETSELLDCYKPLITHDTLLVVISQSGRTAETLRLLKNVTAPIVGITNDPTSPLAQHSLMLLTLQAGEEQCASSKTFTCALAALSLFSAAMGGVSISTLADDLGFAADALQNHLPIWEQQVSKYASRITPERKLVFMGRGAAYASAFTSALLCHEAAKRPAMYLNSGQFRHGFIETLSSDTQYILFTGAHPLDLQLAHEINCAGRRIWAFHPSPISMTPDVATPPFLEIVPAQFLAAHLADQLHIQPEVFRFGQKVTLKE